MAKIVWYNEAVTNDDLVEQYFDYEKATLEHIIPQNTLGTKWVGKLRQEFIYAYVGLIGNMTLLTSKINSRIKNSYFDVKKKEYAKTKLPMTLELANLEGDITEEYIEKRHVTFVKMILSDLGLSLYGEN